MVENVSDPRSNLELAIQTGINAALMDLHTCMPGEIISFDPVEQIADIQLVTKTKQSGELKNRSVLQGVPVRFMATLGFSMTMPLPPGSEVLVVFAERSIDTWLASGGIQDPADIRKHSSSDAFAFPLMYSQPNKISNFDPDNLQIRTASANAKITIKPSGEVELNGSTYSATRFEELEIAFNQLKADYDGHAGHFSPSNISPPASTADISPAESASVRVK